MILIPKIDSNTSEIEVNFVRTSATAETFLSIKDTNGVQVAELELFTYKNGAGKFRLTDDVHTAPFGRYTGTITSGNCVCGCFPIDIPKCNIESVKINQRVNELECDLDGIPERDCAEPVCQNCCTEDAPCCDQCTGCDEINPCDFCHPCYKDINQFIQPSEPTIILSEAAQQALNGN